jgi:hypothetical protein
MIFSLKERINIVVTNSNNITTVTTITTVRATFRNTGFSSSSNNTITTIASF